MGAGAMPFTMVVSSPFQVEAPPETYMQRRVSWETRIVLRRGCRKMVRQDASPSKTEVIVRLSVCRT